MKDENRLRDATNLIQHARTALANHCPEDAHLLRLLTDWLADAHQSTPLQKAFHKWLTLTTGRPAFSSGEIFRAGWQAHEQQTSDELARMAALGKENTRQYWVWPGQSLEGAPDWVLNFWQKSSRRNRIQFEYDEDDTRKPILVVPCEGGSLVARPGDILVLLPSGVVTVRH